MKYFIITVDTEGDNLWDYKKGQEVKTENSLYIPRFQELCEKYGFKPVWLTNYEMASDNRYVEYIKPRMEQGLCEVGIHVHAWNNPPLYELRNIYGGNPYLIEYPNDIMYAKFKATYDLIYQEFKCKPVCHRAGRWAMNNAYFRLLEEFDILADCSYTPTVSWKGAPGATVPHGPDYTSTPKVIHRVGNIWEIPTTVAYSRIRAVRTSPKRTAFKALLKGKNIWLRPAYTALDDMMWLSRKMYKDRSVDYLMFMMHSSEMMPGGSPYFPDEKSIEDMYKTIDCYFNFIISLGYEGVTMNNYIKRKNEV